jgi:RNA polymerase sigma-70 factor (ECF subfamily)
VDRLDAIVREHRAYVRASLARFGVPDGGLDDATQEVFLVVVRRRADFDPTSSHRRWLWGISKNVARNWRRSERRRPTTCRIEPMARPPVEDRLHAQQVVGVLDEHERHVWLARAQGHTAQEIAATLDVPVTTVQWRIRTAKQRVHAMVAAAGRRCRAIAVWFRGSLPRLSPSASAVSGLVLIGWAASDAPELPQRFEPRDEPSIAIEATIPSPPQVVIPFVDATPREPSLHGVVSDDAIEIFEIPDADRRPSSRERRPDVARPRARPRRAHGTVIPLEPRVVRMPPAIEPPVPSRD